MLSPIQIQVFLRPTRTSAIACDSTIEVPTIIRLICSGTSSGFANLRVRTLAGFRTIVALVSTGQQVEAEFTTNNSDLELLHCHQQDHMDMGFMMLFRYV